MSYTREQAEEVLKDWNKWRGAKLTMHEYNIEFLNHKFGKQLEVVKWYKYDESDSKVCYQGEGVGFGTWLGVWCNGLSVISNNWQPMTDQEVHDFLKFECEKRYKVGDVVKGALPGLDCKINRTQIAIISHYLFIDSIPVLDLNTGEWADVIKKDPIAEQIEKLEKELQTLKSKYNEQNK